jgi:hypothetical protein
MQYLYINFEATASQVLVEIISVDRDRGRFSLREVEYEIVKPSKTSQQKRKLLLVSLHYAAEFGLSKE